MINILKKIFSKWYLYAIGIVLSVFIVSYYLNTVTSPKDEETITIFIDSPNDNKEKVYSFLEETAPDYLREINVFEYSHHKSDFSYYMTLQGLNNADIFILSESTIFDELLSNQFCSLNIETLNSYYSFEYGFSNYGILIHQKDGEDKKIIKFKNANYEDENYYLFFRENSLHLGGLNNSKFDTALNFAKALVSYETN